jgi:hypothetical protein
MVQDIYMWSLTSSKERIKCVAKESVRKILVSEDEII